jgi:hypothetical protein
LRPGARELCWRGQDRSLTSGKGASQGVACQWDLEKASPGRTVLSRLKQAASASSLVLLQEELLSFSTKPPTLAPSRDSESKQCPDIPTAAKAALLASFPPQKGPSMVPVTTEPVFPTLPGKAEDSEDISHA